MSISNPIIPDLYKFYSSGMFRHAPFTKFWLVSLICCSAIKITQEIYLTSAMRVASMAEVANGKILHLIYSPFVASNVPELTISALLIYFFRIIERRFGTKKYINCLITTLITSQFLRYLIVKIAFPLLSPERIPFPGSPLILLTSIYCQYILEIPVYAIYKWMEIIPISEHHFILFLLAQIFSTFTVLHFIIPGIFSTVIYRLNLFFIQKLSFIPEFITKIARDSNSFLGSWIQKFEEIFETRKFKALPIAATLERQRIEEDDEIQRQMFQQNLGRSTARLMGVRRALGPPPESLIQSLVGMGFENREEVFRAFQEANHNLDVAANLLLRRTFN